MGNSLPKLVTSGVLGIVLGFLGAKSTQRKLPASPTASQPASERTVEDDNRAVEEDLQAARAARARGWRTRAVQHAAERGPARGSR